MSTVVPVQDLPLEAVVCHTPRQPSKHFYRPELDALRFFAFCLVFLSHSIPLKPASPHWLVALRAACAFGVPIFFALSSYLITELLIRERESTGTVDLKSFYVRRILRIWPLYFLALFAGSFIGHFTGTPISAGALGSYLLLVGNWYTIAHGMLPLGLSILWSLNVEEQFYLVWPWLARRASRQGVFGLSIGAWLVSQIGLLMLCAQHGNISHIWQNSLTHVQYFAIGAGLSAFLEGGTITLARSARAALLAAGIATFYVANLVFNAFIYAQQASITHTYPGYVIAGLGVISILLATLGSRSGEADSLKYLGKISYGPYVYHLPAILLATVIGQHFLRSWVSVVTFAISIPLTLLLAWASYKYFEVPFLKLKRNFEVVRTRVL